jgi:Mrp family chromosome partitioning ATPase
MSTPPAIFFDQSMPALVRAVVECLGADALDGGLIVRDTSGRLRFFASQTTPSDEQRDEFERRIQTALGPYAQQDGVLGFADEPGVQRLLDLRQTEAFAAEQDHMRFSFLDRRIVGMPWLNAPQETLAMPARIVFASLKGGVGRSTALVVVAADLARRNKNVLVVDLDLEAPGIGDMLLGGDRLPRFGTLDYLVEHGIRGIEDRQLTDFVGTSSLTTPEGGRVDVLPVFGKQVGECPANTLPKLARALIEDIDSDGATVPIGAKISRMLDRFTRREAYDAILIDCRAGLTEIAAPGILDLGANVLLFGTAQRQTISGYESLFAGLKLLAERDLRSGRSAAWRMRLKAVLAKASSVGEVAERHRDDLFDLFAENLYDSESDEQDGEEAISYGIDDPNAPHWPLVVPFNQNFMDFDPTRKPDQLSVDFYESTFRPFLNGIDSILASASTDQNPAEDTNEQ